MMNKTPKSRSRVWFHNARSNAKLNRLGKLAELIAEAGLVSGISRGDLVAIKLHWGEPGNVGHLPPPYLRPLIEAVRAVGGKPFLTDTNTLYTGMRRNAVDHVQAAAMNGFSLTTLGVPLVVADGLKGFDGRDVPLAGKQEKVGFVNCMINLTPDCDCCDWNDPPFVADVGFLASKDPVAVDVDSADLVAAGTPIPGSVADGGPDDPWRAIVDIDYRVIFRHGEQIGLGRQTYDLVKL